MPFQKGHQLTRKDPKDCRSIQFNAKVSQAEYERIKQKLEQYGLSKADLIVRAIDSYGEK